MRVDLLVKTCGVMKDASGLNKYIKQTERLSHLVDILMPVPGMIQVGALTSALRVERGAEIAGLSFDLCQDNYSFMMLIFILVLYQVYCFSKN